MEADNSKRVIGIGTSLFNHKSTKTHPLRKPIFIGMWFDRMCGSIK